MVPLTYIRQLTLAGEEAEREFFNAYSSRGVHPSPYPYGIFPQKGLEQVDFAPITIFCGDNGSGKTTLLNIIAQCLDIRHDSPYNISSYLSQFATLCYWDYSYESEPWVKKIITSDDVFHRSFHQREANHTILDRQYQVHEEAVKLAEDNDMSVNFEDPEDVARFQRKALTLGRGRGHHKPYNLVMKEVGKDIVLHSNGENALAYFEEQLTPHGLYLLDEPENSLSIGRQLMLKELIESMAQYDSCQFVIATHSPFLLALSDARVYNLDLSPVRVQTWTNIEHVRDYFDFFRAHEQEFDQTAPDESVSMSNDSLDCQLFRRLMQHGYKRQEAEDLMGYMMTDAFVQECQAWIDEYVADYHGADFPDYKTLHGIAKHIYHYGYRPPYRSDR